MTKEALNMAIKALKETDRHGNCELNICGECSYRETGCSDCKMKEKIKEALRQQDAIGDLISQEGVTEALEKEQNNEKDV